MAHRQDITSNTVALWSDMLCMGVEAQYIIGMRVAGMMGVLPHAKDENVRMVVEKGDAVRESFGAAFKSAASGQRADEILRAALRPYCHRTRANARRLRLA